jgi:TolB protein
MRVPAPIPTRVRSRARRRGRQVARILLASVTVLAVAACGASGPSLVASAAPSAPAPSTPAWVTGLGGRIAFTKETGSPTTFAVMTMAPDGSDLRTVGAPSSTSIVHVVWGPGGRFTFDSDRGGQNQVFSMDPSGGQVLSITTGPDGHAWPAVSPDGRTTAFDDWIGVRDFGIHLARADGSEPHARTLTTSADPAKGGDTQPAFSPDGTQVAFQRWVTSDRANPKAVTAAIFVVGIDGKGLRQLTPYDMDAGLPRWAPDGSKILFTDHADTFDPKSQSANLWTVRPDGSALTKLTHETGGNFAAEGSWSPDGSAIVFSSWFGADPFTALRVMRADGSEATPILTSTFAQGGAGEMPQWSPTR